MFWWVEAAAGTGPDADLGILAQYGVLGVFAVVLLLFARISYRRETERADRLEAEVIRLNNLIIDRAVPALTAAAQAAEEATHLMRELQREREMNSRAPVRRVREDPR